MSSLTEYKMIYNFQFEYDIYVEMNKSKMVKIHHFRCILKMNQFVDPSKHVYVYIVCGLEIISLACFFCKLIAIAYDFIPNRCIIHI